MRPRHVLYLAVKELRGLARDPLLLALVFYAFTLDIYSHATAMPESLNRATISIVDEDASPLSRRIADAFLPPYFVTPDQIDMAEMDARMDAGIDTFSLVIPPNFQGDLIANARPEVQLNVDATRVSQAFTGAGYIQAIVNQEITGWAGQEAVVPVDLALRARFNPSLDPGWFGALTAVISAVTMLSIILSGAALIREREHGTVEHLLVMPVSPVEIMTSKVLSMGGVVLVATGLSLTFMVQGVLEVPVAGSVTLFLVGAALHLFATTSLGVLLATISGSMPQFAMLLLLVLLPLEILSGGMTPRESMPEVVQYVMLAAPNTHFIALAQAVLFRGAGFAVVWPQLLALAVIGTAMFAFALRRFRDFLR
ncbi:ABC transporter permease [Seohaeicola saemankumensis]|jgi:ABC-2 type transport system permease protein|uniref:ABC transporter permease n=1 Tax=Seohaeicola saemankumensis TaxID=481181 RepID=UPI001E2B41D6|nr:ABC transporter permease [Seohaeicola saemankumensis]MCD1627687.1 ABC transporter permease [Seohaeicola saemankumensis]